MEDVFWSVFFFFFFFLSPSPPHWSRRSINTMNKNTGEIRKLNNSGCYYEGLFLCSNFGSDLFENEGTNERTATGHWRCLDEGVCMNIIFTNVVDLKKKKKKKRKRWGRLVKRRI
ncbi:hypothetical protein INR49_032608 [Caranx melampygus]|nr:hypothetical protein INR49_032608 [Caranx melampygus]